MDVASAIGVVPEVGARGLGPFAGRLRYVEIGSAAMPPPHKQALMNLLPKTELWMHYGLTEASRSAFIEFHRDRDRLDTVGRAAPGVRRTDDARDGVTRRFEAAQHLLGERRLTHEEDAHTASSGLEVPREEGGEPPPGVAG